MDLPSRENLPTPHRVHCEAPLGSGVSDQGVGAMVGEEVAGLVGAAEGAVVAGEGAPVVPERVGDEVVGALVGDRVGYAVKSSGRTSALGSGAYFPESQSSHVRCPSPSVYLPPSQLSQNVTPG